MLAISYELQRRSVRQMTVTPQALMDSSIVRPMSSTSAWCIGPGARLRKMRNRLISRSMSLRVGTALGAYEVVALEGVGGMGEVYRARDTKLRRDVALKVLPERFAADPHRLARFTREAHVLA